jgi:hypothetical protein
MSFAIKLNACTVLLAAPILFAGCSSEKANNTPAPPAGTGANNATPAAAGAADASITAALAELPAEDRALAEKQKICPVSGEPLGGMGKPKKLNIAGHEVFICCEACEQSLRDEPDKYLAKIGINSNDGPALK